MWGFHKHTCPSSKGNAGLRTDSALLKAQVFFFLFLPLLQPQWIPICALKQQVLMILHFKALFHMGVREDDTEWILGSRCCFTSQTEPWEKLSEGFVQSSLWAPGGVGSWGRGCKRIQNYICLYPHEASSSHVHPYSDFSNYLKFSACCFLPAYIATTYLMSQVSKFLDLVSPQECISHSWF